METETNKLKTRAACIKKKKKKKKKQQQQQKKPITQTHNLQTGVSSSSAVLSSPVEVVAASPS